MLWIVPSFTDGVRSVTAHLSIIAPSPATMLSRSQVEEPRTSNEAEPAAVTPLAAPQLASSEKAEQSPPPSSDAPRDLGGMVGVVETLVTPEAEEKASQIPPDPSAASQGPKSMATASSVPTAPGWLTSAAEVGAGAVRSPEEDAEPDVIARSAGRASESPVHAEAESASSRRIESMPRESHEAADAVVPTKPAIANPS